MRSGGDLDHPAGTSNAGQGLSTVDPGLRQLSIGGAVQCPALGGNAEARSTRNEFDALALLNSHWWAQHVAAQGSAGGHADGNGLTDCLLAFSEDAGRQCGKITRLPQQILI